MHFSDITLTRNLNENASHYGNLETEVLRGKNASHTHDHLCGAYCSSPLSRTCHMLSQHWLTGKRDCNSQEEIWERWKRREHALEVSINLAVEFYGPASYRAQQVVERKVCGPGRKKEPEKAWPEEQQMVGTAAKHEPGNLKVTLLFPAKPVHNSYPCGKIKKSNFFPWLHLIVNINNHEIDSRVS